MWKRQVGITLIIVLGLPIIYFLDSRKQPTTISSSNRSDPPNDQFTICLLEAHRMFSNLSLPWFLAFGTALMYYRSNNFVSDDIDIGIFVDDLDERNITNSELVSNVRQHGFKLLRTYGNRTHGQGWTLVCPRSRVHFGIFVFYHADPANNETFAWWTASYNGLCNNMRYRKCRWWFSHFKPGVFTMYRRSFQIAPQQFLVEQYGPDWMSPRKYGYFQSLTFLPNLIDEHLTKTS